MKRDWAFWGAIAYLCAAMFISPWFIFGPIAACVALSPVIWLWGWWKGDRNLKELGAGGMALPLALAVIVGTGIVIGGVFVGLLLAVQFLGETVVMTLR